MGYPELGNIFAWGFAWGFAKGCEEGLSYLHAKTQINSPCQSTLLQNNNTSNEISEVISFLFAISVQHSLNN